MTEAPVLVERRGRLGVLTLNRPRAINALDAEMVGIVTAALEEWAVDDAVAAVLVTGAGERGLCAGGDVVTLYRAAIAGDRGVPERFWRDEYRMNALIARFPKPYVAFMDGIVLGGGVGVSAHGSHRIVTERSRVGMPETIIGFAPDVGGTWLLARAPGELGTHAALTGSQLSGADAIALGLADAFVPSERLPALAAALETEEPDAAIAAVAQPAPASALIAERAWIDAAYAGDDLSAILARFATGFATDPGAGAGAGAGAEPARAAAETLAQRSPTSLALTLRGLRTSRAEHETLDDALRREFRVAMRLLDRPDFAEGVRAQLVDKDRAPRWDPATVADVDPAVVAAAFAPVDPELALAP